MDRSEGPPPSLGDHFLNEWAAERGPLFEDPRAAVCRIYAVIVSANISENGPDRELRLRAARMLDEALAPLPASNRPATREQRARVNMALVDVRRALRKSGPFDDITEELERILGRATPRSGWTEELRTRAFAEHLAGIVQGERRAVQLRAARTILARTRDAWRRVGRPASPDSPEDAAKAPRASAPAPARRDGFGGAGHPAQQSYECSPEHAGRGPP